VPTHDRHPQAPRTSPGARRNALCPPCPGSADPRSARASRAASAGATMPRKRQCPPTRGGLVLRATAPPGWPCPGSAAPWSAPAANARNGLEMKMERSWRCPAAVAAAAYQPWVGTTLDVAFPWRPGQRKTPRLPGESRRSCQCRRSRRCSCTALTGWLRWSAPGSACGWRPRRPWRLPSHQAGSTGP